MESYFGLRANENDKFEMIRFDIAKHIVNCIEDEEKKVKPKNIEKFYLNIAKMLQDKDKFVKFMTFKMKKY